MSNEVPASRIPLAALAPALWAPEYFVGDSAWIEHAPFAFWLIDVLRPRNFVELGAHSGYSYFCFCQAVQRLNLATTCHAVDAWTGDEHAGFYGEQVFQAVARHNERYSAFSTLLRMTFDDARRQFPDGGIDLLHIDGRHYYDDVRHDFEAWRDTLADNAIVLFHDTDVRERGFGVWKLFGELKRDYATFEFTHGHGLGVLAVKDVPSALRPLFDADQDVAEQWRHAFASLGGAIGEIGRLRRPEAQLQQAEAQLQETQRRLREANERAEARAAVTVEKRAVVASLARRTTRLRGKRSRLDKLWGRIRAAVQPAKADLAILRRSLFLDEEWYLAAHPDVVAAGLRPAEHYLAFGAGEGRDPGPFFSTRDYLANNPGVAKAGLAPLLHFEKHGWRNERALAGPDLTELDRFAIRQHIASLAVKPLICVVMPVCDPPAELLRQAVESVIAQSYPNWRLCIASGASRDSEVAQVLEEFVARDSRIRVVHHEADGDIGAAGNSALAIAEGDFVALMDHDGLLHETALYEAAVEIIAHPDVDLIYSDEDEIDEDGNRSAGYFKTDFNPELLLGQNMVGRFGVYRRGLIEKIGRFRPGFEGSQDYDLALRAWASSSSERIRHIPATLYHRRRGTRAGGFSEPRLERGATTARKAIQEFLDREGEGARVVAAPNASHWSRVIRRIPEPKPLVSVIVLTRDRADLMSVCADGLLNKTDYPNLELLIVDHESKERRSHALFEKLKRDPRVRIVPYVGAFNFSAMNNMAAASARGTVLALVNNDIEVISPDWLTEMVSHAIRPEIGAVGAKLYYPDGRIQHAGVLVGMGGLAGHSFLLEKKNSPGYFGQAVLTRAVSAVTAACLVVRRSVFLEVNGLDAEAFPVAFNDVDLCLKVQAKGYRNVWTPFAELVHHESVSRGRDDTREKKARFAMESANLRDRWIEVIENDPYYNPNLSLHSWKREVAQVSRRARPWAGYM